MFKILRRSTFDVINEQNEYINNQFNKSQEDNEACNKNLEELTKENYELTEELNKTKEELVKLKEAIADQTTVTLSISDDLETVTPIIRYKESIVDTLIESGYIDEANKSDTYVIQIALTTMAEEVLRQMIDQFTGDLDGIE